MIEILEYLHKKYIPIIESGIGEEKERAIIQKILFRGDNLTEERTRNLQGAMADGSTSYESLQGIISENEDWHDIRIQSITLYIYIYIYIVLAVSVIHSKGYFCNYI